jgi:hypothetical protein
LVSVLKKERKNGPGFSSSSPSPQRNLGFDSCLILENLKKIQVSISILVLKIRSSYLEPNFQNQKFENKNK